MDRRALLRTLAVLGLAGCTPDRGSPLDAGAPSPTPPGGPTSSPADPAPSSTPPAPAEPSPVDQPATAAPTAQDEPTPSAAPAPREVVAVSREALGLPAPLPGGEAHTITGLMLHHTAAPTAPAARAPDRFRGITRSHRDAGFVDAAYHWGVDVDGNVYELRDEAVAGETFTDYDPAGWFLVVCEGNFEESRPPAAMLDAVADVFAYGAARFGVDPATLVGHRDRAATACPGVHLHAALDELAVAVADRLAAGGVALRTTDDPDAVQAIEQA